MPSLKVLHDANSEICEFLAKASQATANDYLPAELQPAKLDELCSLSAMLEHTRRLIEQEDLRHSTDPQVKSALEIYKRNLERLHARLSELELVVAARRVQLWQQQQHLAAAGAWAESSRKQHSGW